MATASKDVIQDISLNLMQRQTVSAALRLKHASVVRAANAESNAQIKALREAEAADIMHLSSLFVL